MVAEETSSENAFETTLTAPMGPTDLMAAVVTKGSLTSAAILVIEPDDDAQREIIRFNGTWGASTFVTQSVAFRYLPGSAAPSGLTHPSGAIVRSVPTAQHIEDLNDRVDTLDHGADLAGLGDDDHTQYHTDIRGDARYVELAGDTMTGDLVLNADPDTALKAATKQYVDNADKGFRQVSVFEADGTFSKASFPWLKRVRVRVVGAGAGGGGTPAIGSAEWAAAGGGGGGGYSEATIEVSALAASETVTVGVGGPGVTGAGGTAGENSSFGTHCVAEGGFGGFVGVLTADNIFTMITGGIGGRSASGTGDATSGGNPGGSGIGINRFGIGQEGGTGGSSVLGGGGKGGKQGAGSVGDQYGGGGAAFAATQSTSAQPGAAGGDGVVIVELYA